MNINYKKIIIFAIIIGIYTGCIMTISIFNNTSIQDIGISYEWWILFAIVIVYKSKNYIDAGLKCFIFFLISQPIIYLTEIVLGHISLSLGIYYYTRIWLPMTILTLPGGMIAYLIKKENIIGSIILAISNTFLLVLFIYYLINVIISFPSHLFSMLCCILFIIISLIFVIKDKKMRIISLISTIIITLLIILLIKINGLYIVSGVF